MKQFLDVVNEMRQEHSAGPMSFNSAVKFMTARKFDIHRALSLYEAHEITRFREGLAKFDPLKDPLKTELESGKFTVLVSFSFEIDLLSCNFSIVICLSFSQLVIPVVQPLPCLLLANIIPLIPRTN